MTDEIYSYGPCTVCKKETNLICDNCQNFACESHSKPLKCSVVKTLDICTECWKNIEVGKAVAGVEVTDAMLNG